MLSELLRGRSLLAKLVRFFAVGVTCSALYAMVTWALAEFLAMNPTPASFLGYLCAIPTSFLLQKYFTFRSDAPKRTEFPRFVLTHAINLGLSTLAMYLTVDKAGLDYRLGILVVSVFVPILSFLTMNVWVFQQRHAGLSGR